MIFFNETDVPTTDTPPATRDVERPFIVGPALLSDALADRDEDAAPFVYDSSSAVISVQAADTASAVIFLNVDNPAGISFTWTGATKPSVRITSYPDVNPTLAQAGAERGGWFAVVTAGETLTLNSVSSTTVNRMSVGNLIGEIEDWPQSRGQLVLNERRKLGETGLVHVRRNANARLQLDLSFRNHSQQADADLMRTLSNTGGAFMIIPLSRGTARGSEWQQGDVCRRVEVSAFAGFQGHAGISSLGPTGNVRFNEPPGPATNISIFPDPPAVPTGLALTPTSNTTISADWDDILGAITYDLQFDTLADFSTATLVEGLTASTHIIENLTGETQYFVRVRSVNEGGASDWSAGVSTTTLGIPSVPANVTLTPGPTNIFVDWDDTQFADDYDVRFAATEGGLTGATPTNVLVSQFDITGLSIGDTRFVQVRANSQDGSSDYSTAQSATTAVAAPANFAVAARGGGFFASWDAVASAVNYEVEYDTDPGFPAPVTVDSADLTELVTSLTVGTTYHVRVRAELAGPTFSLYTTAISVVPLKFDADFSSVILLVNGETAIEDESNSALTATIVGDLAIASSEGAYGTGAIDFDGTAKYVRWIDAGVFDLAARDFTFEMWLELKSSNVSNARIFGNDGANNMSLLLSSGTTLQFFHTGAAITSSIVMPTETPVHVAVTRSGTTLRLHQGGVQVATGTDGGTVDATGLDLGSVQNNAFGQHLNSYMNGARVTDGVARYGAATFTPDQTPWATRGQGEA